MRSMGPSEAAEVPSLQPCNTLAAGNVQGPAYSTMCAFAAHLVCNIYSRGDALLPRQMIMVR